MSDQGAVNEYINNLDSSIEFCYYDDIKEAGKPYPFSHCDCFILCFE